MRDIRIEVELARHGYRTMPPLTGSVGRSASPRSGTQVATDVSIAQPLLALHYGASCIA